MKSKLILILIGSVLSFGMFMGCSEQKTVTDKKAKEVTEDVKDDEKISKIDAEYKKLSKSDAESVKEINSELGVRISKSKKIIIKDESKKVIIKDVNENKEIDNISVQNKGNYFVEVIGNDDFIVWSESNYQFTGDGSREEPDIIKWAVYYKNLKTNEIKLIEEDSHKIEEMHNRSMNLDIDGANLVYTNYEDIDGESISNIVYYNLEKAEKKVITENPKGENIGYVAPRISKNNIIFLGGTNAETGLQDKKMFNYNLENDVERTIIEGLGINTYQISGKDSKGNSMYQYNISSGKLENLFYEGSKIKEVYPSEGDIAGIDMLIGNSSDKYISMDLMSDKDFLIYDMENQEFLDLRDLFGEDFIVGGQVRIVEDNLVEVEIYGEKTYDIELKDKEK
ncbi:MAG: hypothetical protein ACRCWG_06380 [Sarcina sp.]